MRKVACPKCGSEVYETEKVCPFCGSILIQREQRAASRPNADTQHINVESSESITQGASETPEGSGAKRSKKLALIVASGVVLLSLLAFGVFRLVPRVTLEEREIIERIESLEKESEIHHAKAKELSAMSDRYKKSAESMKQYDEKGEIALLEKALAANRVAQDELLESMSIGDEADSLRYKLGMSYLRSGRKSDAVSQFQKVVESPGGVDLSTKVAAKQQLQQLGALR